MKRITAFICAFVILLACVPAFAVDFDSIFTSDNYGGSIRSSSFAMDALENLQTYLDGTFPLNSPLFITIDANSSYLRVITPGITYTGSYHAYIQSNNTFVARAGSTLDYTASVVPLFVYSIYIDSSQVANGVFSPTSAWYTSESNYPNVNLFNGSSVFYGNPSVNIYDSSGAQIDWPWTGGGAPIQYQIPLSPGNMLVIEDPSVFSSIRITASGLPSSSGTASPTWFTGLRIGNPTTAGMLFANNGKDTYNSPGTNAFWEKSPFSTGLTGVSTSGIITLTPEDYSNDFLFIYNPIGVTTNDGNIYNPTIYITTDEAPPQYTYIYPAYIADGVTTFPRYGGDPMYNSDVRPVVQVNFNSARELFYSDSNRPTISPDIANVPGGYNGAVDPSDPVESAVGGILGILQSGARAVRSLVSGAQSFFSTLRQMYTWLPDEVYSLLMSCLFLVFCIGVLKVLH